MDVALFTTLWAVTFAASIVVGVTFWRIPFPFDWRLRMVTFPAVVALLAWITLGPVLIRHRPVAVEAWFMVCVVLVAVVALWAVMRHYLAQHDPDLAGDARRTSASSGRADDSN